MRGASDRTLEPRRSRRDRTWRQLFSGEPIPSTAASNNVLLGPPDNFRWLPTSAISKATLESGAVFDAELARSQHRELVAAYESAGVEIHFLETDPALPYQVFARDSSVITPAGAVVTQLKQQWRRGEYAPVIRFYQERGASRCG